MADHSDVVAAVKADLLARGVDLTGPCGAFQITARVGWQLRAEGWGYIHSGGNGCDMRGDRFRADTLMLQDGSVVDILSRSESDNGDTSNPNAFNIPAWGPTGGQPPGNWRAPFNLDAQIVPGPDPGPRPDPRIPDPGPVAATCRCAERLDAMSAKLEALTRTIEALAAKPAPPAPDYTGALGGVKVVLRPSR